MNAQQHADRASRVLQALDAQVLEAAETGQILPAADVQASCALAQAHALTAQALTQVGRPKDSARDRLSR